MSARPWNVRFAGMNPTSFVAFVSPTDGGPTIRVRWRRPRTHLCDACGYVPDPCEHVRAALRQRKATQ